MKKTNNIETKYKHPNEHIFVIASRPIVHGEVLAKCTCGYETRTYDKKNETCPNCNSKVHEKYMSARRNHNISQIYGYEFTEEKAIINYRRVEVNYRQDEEDAINDSLALHEIKTDFVIEYETNKKGKKQFKPKRIVTEGDIQVTHKLLKSEIEYIYQQGDTERIAIETLRKICSSGNDSNLASMIWGIHNKYKYCYDAIQKGFLIGYDYEISSLKKWNDFVSELSDKEIEGLKVIYDTENKTSYHSCCTYHNVLREFKSIREDFGDTEELHKFISIKSDLHKKINELREIIPLDLSRYNTELADMIYHYKFTIEEIGELFAHAERQAFNLRYEFSNLVRGYKIYHKLGMPIDKKPRELAIYLAKMKAINDIINYYSNKNFSLKDESEDKNYHYSLTNNFTTVKTVYDNFGLKGLNALLVNHHMNKYRAYTLLLNNLNSERSVLATAFVGKDNNLQGYDSNNVFLPDILLTLDGQIIEDKKEIRETIIELTKEKLMTKGEVVC